MTFFASWKIHPDDRNRVLERFIHTKGSPPEGVRIIGRWHRADGTGGFMIVEAKSMRPVTEFAYEWNDLLFVEIAPVVDDEGLTPVLARFKSRTE